jgi:SAM-dependent methyltransferase
MKEAGFKDHFSGHAPAYAGARPHYPDELFAWLATLTAKHDAVWDCGTGNGQAALGLAGNFRRVIATDPSRQQIESAFPHVRIEYRVASAESPGLGPHSVDLVTVAQALHWFDRPNFYRQVRKVLRPAGAIAVWCYGLCSIEPVIDARVRAFYDGETAPYWPPERVLIDQAYATIDFPFAEIMPPALRMQQHWTLEQFTAYLRTWSAVQKFIGENGRDPVSVLKKEIEKLWGSADTVRAVSWPLHIRAGRM